MRSPTVQRTIQQMRTSRVIAITSLVGLSGATHLPLAEAATVVRFRTCAELNGRYPGGIGRAGAVDAVAAGGRRSTAFHVSTELYGASRALDTDHDGIACERVVPSTSASVGAGAAIRTGPGATTGPTTEPTVSPNNEPTSTTQASTTFPPITRPAIPARSSANAPPSIDLRVVSSTLPTAPPPAEPPTTAVCNPRFAIACTKA